ncbi:Uncharacterised protein [uncultured Blautia sp.]|nr:Uncharacterised protein [uncultured Blautia sp.]
MPLALHCSSVRPTEAASGSIYTQVGLVFSSYTAGIPMMFSAATSPMALAVWASWALPKTQSPMAYTPGTLVSILSLTMIRPRSLARPAASRFRLAVLAFRPMATSTFSASKLTVSPALFLQTTLAPTGEASTACTGHSRLNSMPIFFMCFTPMAVRSPSSMGSMWSSASTTVILVPKAA